ncbi:hypothetical protein FNV43_RR05165 [Rhamnella rubrinervis]|uniref:Uncharacterized protein n=1 Tax=Rhamnella rubrinervis TaxID=2594499 RepID=A0A8K0MQE9_9ROSA|nr:hypothetical protein FNV43_RR05165 [Rhamnella rubrinervis]
MAQQEEGWPLGLQPINVRVGLARNHDFSGSVSFNTLITGSPTSSTDSSSDLDTESTGSFFHDKSITLGSLIGVTSILELSRRSLRGRKTDQDNCKAKKSSNNKSRIWFFSLCSRNSTDAESVNNAQSLGHFLAVERKAANEYRRNQPLMSPTMYGPDEFSVPQPVTEPNSLFVNGRVAPPQSSTPWCGTEVDSTKNTGLDHGIPLLFSCMCGQPSH